MKKILLFFPLVIWLGACADKESGDEIASGNEKASPPVLLKSNVANAVENKSENPHETVSPGEFRKCEKEYGSFEMMKALTFIQPAKSEKFFAGYAINANTVAFSQENKNLKFNENNPCTQLELYFSNQMKSAKHIKLSLSEKIVNDFFLKDKPEVIREFDKGYYFTSMGLSPDNLSRLPSHIFEISISCPTGLEISCEKNEGKCDFSQGINVNLPHEGCTIKGIDQVFALYPQGQVRINFEGTFKKTGKVIDEQEELEVKFTNVEWK